LTANYRLTDRLQVGSGLASLDLLNGATIDGSAGRPRWTLEGRSTGTYRAYTLGLLGRLQGDSAISSPLPSADLRFSGRTWLVLYGNINLEQLVHRPWARRLTLSFAVENLLNNRIHVRERVGDTPYRFQGAFIDPLGRSIRFGVRKLF